MNMPIDITDVTLTTERLTLRPFSPSDVSNLYEYASVDGVGQPAGWAPHKDILESEIILRMFIEGKHTFAIVHDGKVIGSVGIDSYDEEKHPELHALSGREIGYALARPYWGQDLTPEAVRAVIDYLFDTVGVDFLLAGHFDNNVRSKRVIEKCGFQYLGTVTTKTQLGTTEQESEYILYRSDRTEQQKSTTASRSST